MFKWIKRLFGLDYNDNDANKHNGVGYNGVSPTVEDAVASVPVVEPAVEAAPVQKKKPRKSSAKKTNKLMPNKLDKGK